MFEIKDGMVRLSVRELVEFVYRSGDIDTGKGIAAESMAMQAGTRIHKKIQKSMGTSYVAEVLLKQEYKRQEYGILVEGRADGVITTPEGVTIDEIKGTYAGVADMDEPVFVHKAQAMCYAHMYAVSHGLSAVSVRLTYVNMETEETRYFLSEYGIEELEAWIDDTLELLDRWVIMQREAERTRNASIKQQEFPFEYRDGQRELVVSVYKTIHRKKTLFIQAPTGVGKTMSTMFPAVKAMGEGLGDKIFYLTAKTITRTVAQEALDILADNGLIIKRLTITAKEKICCRETEKEDKKVRCNPVDCPYAKGHYERVNDAVFDMVCHERGITKEVVIRYAAKHEVCPFEMSLDAAYWCDVIICDYNYVFDPRAYLRRFFGEGSEGKYIFLIDEAHNLVDRGRQMYSAAIVKEDIMAFKRLINAYDKKLSAALERCNKAMLELKRQCVHDYEVLDNSGSLSQHLSQAMEQMLRFSETYRNFPEREKYNEYFFQVRDFLNVAALVDEHYVVYSQSEKDGSFMVRLYCVDPSANLNACMEKGVSTVLFSATLLPITYYRELLRGSKGSEDYAVYAHSSFDDRNRCVLLAEDVTTRYTDRGERQYKRVVEYITGMVCQRVGNYMVFFPSYGYMENVLEYMPPLPGVRILVQAGRMSEDEKENFLREFQSNEKKDTLVGFCVMGGVFSEGIDLKEDCLIGAVIVGTGLPQVCTEQEILKKYFDSRMAKGFTYAYVYPGFNKVLQSAGRVIRTSNDRGVILLLDERFLSGQYEGMFPSEWNRLKIVNKNTFQKKIKEFWQEY